MSELSTPRLRLRQWRASDFEPFAALNADPRVMEFMPGLLSAAESDALARRFELLGRWLAHRQLYHPELRTAHDVKCQRVVWRHAGELPVQ